jgi:protoporphyrinogen IX oxidase
MLWLKVLHVIGFAAWMAGMWYLPRLLVYHAGAAPGSELSETFKVMERRLLRVITTPAMVTTLVAGVLLAVWGGWWQAGWLHAKLLLVAGLVVAHGMIARDIRHFAADRRNRSARYFRIFNEVPTLLFVGIVILAIVRPF